nr:tetratricopeptide repeat protein [Anaerolineae bacterium]
MEQANLFLVPVDNKREWYRYHRLFGDLLRYRLREQVGAEGVRRLHRRAAAWYGRTGLVEEAIHHSLAAEDFPRATDLIASICADLVAQSQSHQLLGLVAALPEDLVRTRPHLCVYHAWALGLTGQVDAVASRLTDAERALSTAPPTLAREIRGQIATLRAYDARRQHDLATAIGLLRQALHYLPDSSLRARSAANANLGVNHLMLGNLVVAREALRVAQTEAHASGNMWIAVGATSYLADTYAVEGRLAQATRLYQEAIAQGLDFTGEHSFPPAGHAYAGLGRVLYEQGEVDEARRNLKQAIDLGEMIGFWNTVLRALVPLVWLEHVQGNTALSWTLLQRALNLAERTSEAWMTVRWEAHLAALQACLSLAQDPPELAAATRWAEAYHKGEPDVTSYEEEFAQLTLARVELAQGHPDRAVARLEVLAEAAGEGGRNDSLIRIFVVQALAQAAQDAGDRAADALNRALDLA